MQHPDEGTIHAWLDESDALSPRERAEIGEHVAGCPKCQEAVAEARGMIAGASRIVSSLDVVRGDVIPAATPQPRRVGLRQPMWRLLRLTPGRAALAATLMIAVASLLVIRQGQGPKVGGSEGRRVGGSEGQREGAGAPGERVVAATPAASPNASLPMAPAPAPATRVGSAPSAVGKAPMVARAPAPKKAEEVRMQNPEGLASADRAKRTDAANMAITSGVATAASPAAQSVASSALRSAAAEAAPPVTADSIAGKRRAYERMAPAVLRSRVVGVSQLEQVVIPGCYEIVNDSGSGHPSFPQRFWLQHAAPEGRIGPLRNVAHALTTDGRIDATVPEGAWRAVSATTIEVSWPSSVGPAALTMSFSASSVFGEAPTTNGPRRVEIRRIACPQ